MQQCLDSLLNQTLKDIEIIIINDGSTDNSEAICRDYASRDSRIKLICKENAITRDLWSFQKQISHSLRMTGVEK